MLQLEPKRNRRKSPLAADVSRRYSSCLPQTPVPSTSCSGAAIPPQIINRAFNARTPCNGRSPRKAHPVLTTQSKLTSRKRGSRAFRQPPAWTNSYTPRARWISALLPEKWHRKSLALSVTHNVVRPSVPERPGLGLFDDKSTATGGATETRSNKKADPRSNRPVT